jgi:hypothetical protein
LKTQVFSITEYDTTKNYAGALLINAFGERKLERPHVLNDAELWAKYQSLKTSVEFMTATEPKDLQMYWEKQQFKKPYWFDNYLLNGLLYDHEFERDYDIFRMKNALFEGLENVA